MAGRGKLTDFVDEKGFEQLDQVFQKLGIVRQEMIDGIAVAKQYNDAIGNAKSLSEYGVAANNASVGMQNLAEKQAQVVAVEREVKTATDALVESTKAKVLADLDAQKVLIQAGGIIDANIRLLVNQRAELANVTAQQKELSKAVTSSTESQKAQSESLAMLTKQQLQLKEAISQNLLFIKQQVKEQVAAEGSNAAQIAQLSQYRTLYNQLNEEERENIEIGGVLLAEIERLTVATTTLNVAQGKYNDNVGNYPKAAMGAAAATEEYSLATALAEKVSAQFVRQLVRMTAEFLLITLAFGAAKWLYDWIANLDIFTGRLDLAVQSLRNFADINKSSSEDAGKNVGSLRILYDATQDLTLSMKDRLSAAKDLQRLYPDQFDASKTQALLNGQEKKSYDDLTQSIIENARADAAKVKIQEIESKIIDEQTKKQQVAAQRMVDLQNVKGPKSNENSASSQSNYGGYASMSQGVSVDEQKKDINAVADAQQSASDKTIKSYNDQIAVIEKVIGIKNLADSVEADGKPSKTPKDKTIDNDIENQKAHLELEKEVAKQILDNEQSSYDARLAALKIYVARSNAIIDLELKDKNSKPGITAKQRDTNNTQAQTQKLGVNDFLNSETLKIQKEAAEEFKQIFVDLQNETLEDLQDSLDKQLIAIKTNETNKETVLLASYKKGLIDEKEYNRQLKVIRDEANVSRLQAQKDNDQAILDIDRALLLASELTGLPIGNATGKTIQRDQNKVTTDSNNLQDAKNTANSDGAGSAKLTAKEETKAILDFAKEAIDALDVVSQLIDQNAKAKLEALQHQGELIQQNAEAEKDAVNSSILSSKEKAREVAIIEAQARAQQQQIEAQERKVKQQEAKFNKALNIAKIIEGTAVAVVNALSIPVYGEALAITIGAIGAAQLAVVASQPIPQYFTGTPSSKEGFAHVGERGTELMIDPSGRMSLTPNRDTVTYLKKGTKIINNEELMRMVGKPELISITGHQAADNKKLESLLEENNRLQKQIANKPQPRTVIKENKGYEAYRNNYFR